MKSKRTVMAVLTVSFFLLTFSPPFLGPAVAETNAKDKVSEELKGPMDKIFSYLYTTANWVGKQVRKGVNDILPENAQIPDSLVDPIGFLILLTVFLAVAEVAKKVTWFLVMAGWLLILVRIGIMIAESYI